MERFSVKEGEPFWLGTHPICVVRARNGKLVAYAATEFGESEAAVLQAVEREKELTKSWEDLDNILES